MLNKFVYLTEPSKPINGWQSTAIMVSLSYWKGKGLCIALDGVTRDENDPPGNFQMMPMTGPEHREKWFEMSRDNKKVTAAQWALVGAQLDSKDGRAWELVKTFAEKHGMTLKG